MRSQDGALQGILPLEVPVHEQLKHHPKKGANKEVHNALHGKRGQKPHVSSSFSSPRLSKDLPCVEIPEGRRFNAVITCISSNSNWFYFQVNENGNLEKLSELEKDLTEWCNDNPAPCSYHHFQPTTVVSVNHSGGWRRAAVHSGTEHRAFLWLLDYGFLVDVPLSQIQPIAMDFLHLPVQVHSCIMKGVEGVSQIKPLAEKYISEIKKAEGFLAKKANYYPFRHVMEFFNVSVSYQEVKINDVFADMLKKESSQAVYENEKTAVYQLTKSEDKLMESPRELAWPPRSHARYFTKDVTFSECPSQLQSVFALIITHVEDVSLFWAVKADIESLHVLITLNERMSRECDAIPIQPDYQPVFDEVVCAQAAEDGLWYRAVVTVVSPEDWVQVFFADYGTCEIMKKDHIRPIVPGYLALPMQAMKLKLHNADSCLSEAAEKFKKVTFVNGIFAEVTSPGEVDLKCPPPLSAVIPDCDIPTDDAFFIAVTSVNSPSDFWAQMVVHSRKLEGMTRKLNESISNESIPFEYHPGVGDFCCAQFDADKSWYRALVVKVVSGSRYLVRFVDYGNSEEVESENVRALEDGLEVLPAMAAHFSLGGIQAKDSPAWSEKACDFFKQSIYGKKLMAKVVDLPSAIDLFDVTSDGGILVNKALILGGFAEKV